MPFFKNSPGWRRLSSLKCLSFLQSFYFSDISPVWLKLETKECLSLPWHIDDLDDSDCRCSFVQCQVTHLTHNRQCCEKNPPVISPPALWIHQTAYNRKGSIVQKTLSTFLPSRPKRLTLIIINACQIQCSQSESFLRMPQSVHMAGC